MRAGAGGDGAASAGSAAIARGAAWLGLLTVVAANLRYLSGLGAALDPMLAMDPYYIHWAGEPLADIAARAPAWGPLYALWLKPLVAALGDPLAVYTANVWLLSLALSALIYLHLLLRTRRPALAVAAALLFLVSDANVPLPGKVSDFALLVLLAGWTAALAVPSGARRAAAAAGTVLAAAYARPELYPAALALALWALWRARAERRALGDAVLAWPAAVLALALVLALSIGTPLAGEARLLDAFREHFAWNWGTWHQSWRYYQAVWDEEFGGAETLRAAFAANPGAVAHHVASNLAGTARFLLVDSWRHQPLLAPAASPTAVAVESWLLAAALLGALAAAALRPTWRRALLARGGELWLAYALVGATFLASAAAIYPRSHYLVIPGVLLLLAGTQAAAVLLPAPRAASPLLRLVAAGACLALVPQPFASPPAARPVADTVALVRSLGLAPPVRVLAMDDGLGELMGPGFEEVKIWQKGSQPLADYLRDRHVDVIVTLQVGHTSFVVDDPLWVRIQNEPQAVGFERVPVPGHERIGVFLPATPAAP